MNHSTLVDVNSQGKKFNDQERDAELACERQTPSSPRKRRQKKLSFDSDSDSDKENA